MELVGLAISSQMDNRENVTPAREAPVAQSTDGVAVVMTIVYVTAASTIEI